MNFERVLFLSVVSIFTLIGSSACGMNQKQHASSIASNKKQTHNSTGNNQIKTASNNHHPKSMIFINGKSPKWLVNDFMIASQVHFPISAQTYALNWNAASYANYDKVFNVFKDTKSIWMGGYTGSIKQQKYSFYLSGPDYDIKKLYEKVKKNDSPFKQVKFIYTLERNSKSGIGHFTPAVSIDLGNGQFLAFASSQVILKSERGGIDQYLIYPVQGIKLPQQPKTSIP